MAGFACVWNCLDAVRSPRARAWNGAAGTVSTELRNQNLNDAFVESTRDFYGCRFNPYFFSRVAVEELLQLLRIIVQHFPGPPPWTRELRRA